MKKVTAFLIAMVVFSSLANAQFTSGKLSGRVQDEKKNALSSATISLLNPTDSGVLKLAAADQAGKFLFENLPTGQYLLAISAVGHTSTYSKTLEISASRDFVEVEPFILKGEAKELKSVTVLSRKPLIEQKMDRTVVNVDAGITNVGATALEVLEKSPGIQVDKDGNISLKGKQGVIIMLDGRPSYLSGPELANMLKGMQASQLDQIEIMTNPPAKYDAAGNSGVINIKTKKNKMKGFNGSISAGFGQGAYSKTNESLSLNYRNGKVNIFGNYSFSRNDGYQELTILRKYKNDEKDVRAIFEQTSLMRNRRMNNNLKIGMDYYADKKNTFGIVISGFDNPESILGTNTSFLKNPESITDSIVYASSFIKEIWKNASVNLNMRHQFDTAGRELTADVDYIKYLAPNSQYFINTTFTPNWTKKYDEQLKGDLPVKIDIYSAKVDYTHPLKKDAKLELGWKSSYVITDSKANYFVPSGVDWVPDYGKTNFFEYKENINAAYLNLNKQVTKKLGVQAGLRYENTHYTGFRYGNPTLRDSSFNRTYDSWFPTVYFSYNQNASNQFGLSFGRRIDRPDYESLNPFLYFLDKYTYQRGNPYLKPQYSNNIELSHIFKGMLTTTLNYSITKDLFAETFDQGADSSTTIVRRDNIGRRENAGISISAQVPVTKWWNSILYTNFNYDKLSGVLYGDPLEVEAGNLMVNINNQLQFKNGWSAELSGWYRTKGIEGQIEIQPMGALSAGVSKQVLKGKGTVKLNVRDVLHTQKAKGQINFKSTEASFMNNRDTRVANITFTYRFGKPLNGNNQRQKGSANEEQNRVKTGE